MQASAWDALSGFPAGRYTIDRVLRGEGGVTQVLARDTQEASRLIRVHCWPAPAGAAAVRERELPYLNEQIALLRQSPIPGFALPQAVEFVDGQQGYIYLLLEHVPGSSLVEELEEGDGVIGWRTYVEWALDLCDTLAALHHAVPPYTLGSLHAGSVCLSVGTGRPILTDPGLHRRSTCVPGAHPGYVPFEQVLGREEPRSDLYALGVLLHYLLSGRDPDEQYLRLRRSGLDCQRALRALFAPLDARSLGIPVALADLVARTTAFTPEDRYPDAQTMKAALLAVRGPAGAVETSARQEPSDDPIWTRLGLSQEQWFALPLQQRNRMLLGALGAG